MMVVGLLLPLLFLLALLSLFYFHELDPTLLPTNDNLWGQGKKYVMLCILYEYIIYKYMLPTVPNVEDYPSVNLIPLYSFPFLGPLCGLMYRPV